MASGNETSPIVITAANINGWNNNEWQEYEGEAVPVQNSPASTQLPFVSVRFYADSFDVTTALEIDAINLTRIQT